ncbi:MAG: hypothetical protein KA783_00015 [Chitinophagales bacterium]|jgi:hypothetical protein|nr:hypothetical protein [Sphingobacteriales bacterium]MBP7532814.1 hypothetical protein [Chitinophagales bacterium]
MNFRFLFFTFLAILSVSVSVQAQETVDQQLQMITTQNNTVNTAIGEGKYYLHRLTINANSEKVWGNISKYQENVNFYFDMRNGLAILRKVIVSADITNRQSYNDYLFDESGNLWLAYANNDITIPDKGARYYFFNKQLINTYYNEKSVEPKDFSTEDQQRGVEMLEKANAYKKSFDALVRLQVNPSK